MKLLNSNQTLYNIETLDFASVGRLKKNHGDEELILQGSQKFLMKMPFNPKI